MLAEADPTHGGTGKKSIAGFEYAGQIVAVGSDTGDWKVGDPFMGTFPSSFAEYLVADHRFVLPRPRDLAPEMRALPTALLTEFSALPVAGFRPGQSVIVTGKDTDLTHAVLAATDGAGADVVLDHVASDTLHHGDITPVVDTILGITQHREAADRLRSGNAVGKVVLTFA
ncbi:hypothetical protein ACFQ7N_08185 [Streptomyces niveus]|uniref:hypothetical protein n=1 Tax=Streptomyces niveus TaxID=193462 RepID=UPI0036A8B179